MTPLYMTSNDLSSQYPDVRKGTKSCGQRETYPSTGHDMWSLDALPSRLLPPHLSCYTALEDLIPRQDSSPFFSSSIFTTPFLRFWPVGRPCSPLPVHFPAWINEKSCAWPPPHPRLDTTNSETSIFHPSYSKYPSTMFLLESSTFLRCGSEVRLPGQAVPKTVPFCNRSPAYISHLCFSAVSLSPPLPQNWLVCWRAFRELVVTV